MNNTALTSCLRKLSPLIGEHKAFIQLDRRNKAPNPAYKLKIETPEQIKIFTEYTVAAGKVWVNVLPYAETFTNDLEGYLIVPKHSVFYVSLFGKLEVVADVNIDIHSLPVVT